MIPVCEPTLNGNELKYVTECFRTNWISSKGKFIQTFEEVFSRFCGCKHGAALSNGTTALHMALEVLGIGKGDEVIIPTFTMIATANAVIYTQAKPVLIDSELDTWNIDITKIEEKITDKTKAIIVVHTYGHPVDMDPVLKIAKKYNLFVIEDAAEAHGAEYKGKRIGSLGDIGCFSFYANKIITTGEGGMIVSNNKEYVDKAKLLRDHAFSDSKRYLHHELGFNYRLTNMQAAVGVAQMERADELVASRIRNAKYYNSLLKDVKGITTPPEKECVKNVYWMYGILIEDDYGINKDDLMVRLKEKGVDTRSFFVGMHKQPIYKKKDERFPTVRGEYPAAEELERKGLYLPSSSHLTEKEIERVVQTIKDIQKEL